MDPQGNIYKPCPTNDGEITYPQIEDEAEDPKEEPSEGEKLLKGNASGNGKKGKKK